MAKRVNILDTLTSLTDISESIPQEAIFPWKGTEDDPVYQLLGMGNLEDYKPMFILDELLALSDMSILAGEPKVGKSTLAKYLMSRVSKGEEFAGRESKKCRCIYYSYESRDYILGASLSKFYPNKENIFLKQVVGQLTPSRIKSHLDCTGARFVVIDTVAHTLDVEDLNGYQQVAKALQKYVDLVATYPVHIMFIHHTPKSARSNKVNLLGAQSIRGATGSNWMYQLKGEDRFLFTEQRELMGTPLPKTLVRPNGDSDFTFGNKSSDSFDTKLGALLTANPKCSMEFLHENLEPNIKLDTFRKRVQRKPFVEKIELSHNNFVYSYAGHWLDSPI